MESEVWKSNSSERGVPSDPADTDPWQQPDKLRRLPGVNFSHFQPSHHSGVEWRLSQKAKVPHASHFSPRADPALQIAVFPDSPAIWPSLHFCVCARVHVYVGGVGVGKGAAPASCVMLLPCLCHREGITLAEASQLGNQAASALLEGKTMDGCS